MAKVQQKDKPKVSILDRIVKKLMIDDYTLDIFSIKVNWFLPSMEEAKMIEVNRGYYEQWLNDSGKLQWCIDYQEAGEHQQQSGEMTLDEYWNETDIEVRYSDLKEYLVKYFDPMKEQVSGPYAPSQLSMAS